MDQNARMKQLANDIDDAFGGWWVWFSLYGMRFSVCHLRSDGEGWLRIHKTRTEETVGAGSVANLAQFVRKYAVRAPVDDDQVFEDLVRAVWVTIFGSNLPINGKTTLIDGEHFLTRYGCDDFLIRLQFVINADGDRVQTIAECIRKVFPTLLSPDGGEYVYSTLRVIDEGVDFNDPFAVRQWMEMKIAEINRLIT